MRTDKIRKYLIPNIPYLFILWAFLKLGTAYRLAEGNDFAHKLIGLGQTIGPAFADFAPGLAPLDWLVGIVGAVGFRLLIYFKSKNAKKFRRDAEYGSARWGTEKDIKPFVDPKFENNVILTGTEFLTMNTRPKIPANARNLNCCIIGSSGSGKTRFWLTPQLLQAHSSYVVVDPKGGVLGQVGGFLHKRGYKIKVFNSIDFSKSMHYNPLAYIRNEADILKFVDALISNTKGEGKEGDPFWTKSETLLYCALIAYIIFEGPAEDRKCWTGAYCRYFREAVLPLDPALEAALLAEGPRPDFKACPVCGRAVAPDGRQTYCSAACAKAAHRRQQREYMRKKRG